MHVGIAMFVTDETVGPGELGALVEARGFDSLFVPEHTHIPLSRLTPHPSGTLQEYYKRTLDPFVALAAAAAVTTTLRARHRRLSRARSTIRSSPRRRWRRSIT